MASVRERIKAALFSNVTQSIAWGLALFANTALVAMGLVNKDVPGAVAAMLGAIAAALMIFSIFLREKADAGDEAETAAQASSESGAAAVGSAKSGEATTADEGAGEE